MRFPLVHPCEGVVRSEREDRAKRVLPLAYNFIVAMATADEEYRRNPGRD